MTENYITFISYIVGGLLFAALTLAAAYLWAKKLFHFSVVFATFMSSCWLFAIAGNYQYYTLAREPLLVLETLRYASWISAILFSLRASRRQIPVKYQLATHGTWFFSLLAITALVIKQHPIVHDSNLLIWNSLLLSIAGLITVEQLYRNAQQLRLMKLLSISAGALFAYDIYLFSYSLIFKEIDINLWQARGVISGLSALALTLGGLFLSRQAQRQISLTVSRPVVFYTTSLSAAGGFLALISIGGYYLQVYGGRWGNVVQVAILFSGLLAILLLFVSTTIRARVNVWISKHFFRHKYDYRSEWLRLINSLTHAAPHEDLHERAIKVIASIFKSDGGSLWLESNGFYRPVKTINMPNHDNDAFEKVDSAFCRAMKESEWVFSTRVDEKHAPQDMNSLLPVWVATIPDIWLILPLLTEERLIGFLILTEPTGDDSLTWEDLDLLKTVGRQVASYLDRHEASEQLARSQQFEAFNKLTAFIMHDLKNLIAQQALVVENAAKHKENPAFVEDAIKTIDNSVGRMSNLLRKLQQQETSEVRSLEIHQVLIDAIKKCQDHRPPPSLRLENKYLKVDADQDYLTMILANIIKNAQEATPDSGFVDVTLRAEGRNAIVTVEDNGAGMDKDFVNNRLFKPFDTTKSGKGMGIGVYQTREFIENLGGTVEVESVLNEGTTFTISIPANAL